MKYYSKMSDFEINNAVLEIAKASRMSGEVVKHPHFADGSSVGLYHKMGDYYYWFNYCNNPSDAWPIIFENEISLVVVEDGVWVARFGSVFDESSNPLRSAMIVYLMMKDKEK